MGISEGKNFKLMAEEKKKEKWRTGKKRKKYIQQKVESK